MARRVKKQAVAVAVDPIHFRDAEDNERSHCKAEEQAQFTGSGVICSTDITEVTCVTCLRTVNLSAYHAWTDDSGKQLRKYPDEWIKLSSRFRVGGSIKWLARDMVRTSATDDKASADRAGMIGVIEKVNDGKRYFWPPRYVPNDSGDGDWLAESSGWLTVRFPGGNHGFDPDGRAKPIAIHPYEEGSGWELLVDVEKKP